MKINDNIQFKNSIKKANSANKKRKVSVLKTNIKSSTISDNISNTKKEVTNKKDISNLKWGIDYIHNNSDSIFLENVQNFIEPINSDKSEVIRLAKNIYNEKAQLIDIVDQNRYYLDKSIEYINDNSNNQQINSKNLEDISYIILKNRDEIIKNRLNIKGFEYSEKDIDNLKFQPVQKLNSYLIQNALLNRDDNKLITNSIQTELEKNIHKSLNNNEKNYNENILRALLTNEDREKPPFSELSIAPLVVDSSTSIIDGSHTRNTTCTLKSIWGKIRNLRNNNNYYARRSWWNCTSSCILNSIFTYRHGIMGAFGGANNLFQNWLHPKSTKEKFVSGLYNLSNGLWDKCYSELLSLKGDFKIGKGITSGISGFLGLF